MDLMYFDDSDQDEVVSKCKREYLKTKINDSLLRALVQLNDKEGHCNMSEGNGGEAQSGEHTTNAKVYIDGIALKYLRIRAVCALKRISWRFIIKCFDYRCALLSLY